MRAMAAKTISLAACRHSFWDEPPSNRDEQLIREDARDTDPQQATRVAVFEVGTMRASNASRCRHIFARHCASGWPAERT
jgi:hypothetical protein